MLFCPITLACMCLISLNTTNKCDNCVCSPWQPCSLLPHSSTTVILNLCFRLSCPHTSWVSKESLFINWNNLACYCNQNNLQIKSRIEMWDMILFSLNRETEIIKDPSFQIFNYLKRKKGCWKLLFWNNQTMASANCFKRNIQLISV